MTSVHRRRHHEYHSVVNVVRKVEADTNTSPSNVCIDKRYLPYARGTGVAIPQGRALVEFRTLTWLGGFLRARYPSLYCPDPIAINTDDYTLRMSFLNGPALESTERWPDSDLWYALGHLLGTLGSLSLGFFQETYADLEAISATSRAALMAYKFPTAVVGPNSVRLRNAVFSLGDVSLANILYLENGLGLIDFEFAGLGPTGFDCGQIAGQLAATPREASDEVRRASTAVALAAGFESAGGDIDMFDHWRGRFSAYYRRRLGPQVRGGNPTVVSSAADDLIEP